MAMIKTSREINLLKKSAQISDSCIKVIEKSLKENITEKELRRRVERKIRSQNASLAFRTLVACGDRSSMIHSDPHATDKMISGIGYVDFGASYKRYETDVTVPFTKGFVGVEEKRIIKAVLNAYKASLKTLKLGTPCWKTHEAAYNYSVKNGYRFAQSGKIKHMIGHGIGLGVHEPPYIFMPSKKKLSKKGAHIWKRMKSVKYQNGMVFAIEPGIYVKGKCGCRIENDFLMTSNGPVALTHAKLIEV
jgi:Xaa-Pro dipeptidase